MQLAEPEFGEIYLKQEISPDLKICKLESLNQTKPGHGAGTPIVSRLFVCTASSHVRLPWIVPRRGYEAEGLGRIDATSRGLVEKADPFCASGCIEEEGCTYRWSGTFV